MVNFSYKMALIGKIRQMFTYQKFKNLGYWIYDK